MDNLVQVISTASDTEEVWFTKLDLNYAFSQLPLSDETSKHCNFSIVGGKATGTYRFLTGFYGLTDMPTEFQKAMDRTLLNLANTFCFLDDILIVSVGSVVEHNKIVEEVLKRILEEGFSLKLSNCEFSKKSIEWLGYFIDRNGYKPLHSKVQDILALTTPKSLTKLISFIGSINHLQKFIKGANDLVADFKDSLSHSNKLKFYWSDLQTKAFNELKNKVAEITQNYHYNPKRQTRLKCDASKNGLGACLEQQLSSGDWVPISFASRQLNPQEAKYSTSELELLAVVWSTYHYRYYLYGNRFEINTDHKALLSALKANRGNKTYQSRLVRWVDKLLPFDFTIKHLPGKEMGFTDYLSRDASGEPETVSSYDEKFVVASISNYFRACDFIKGAAEPEKISPSCSKKQSLQANFVRRADQLKFPDLHYLDNNLAINEIIKSKTR